MRAKVPNINAIALAGAVAVSVVFPAVVSATTILAVRTPTEIYVGNTFVTAAGPYMAPGLNVKSSFIAAQAGGGSTGFLGVKLD